jgi:hypothetical protein
MKKIIIFSLMLISALSVDAQRKRTRTATSQGNVVVRLGMGINSTKSDPDLDPIERTSTINFTPSVGYMVVDNLELGVDLSINNSWGEDVTTQSPVVNKNVTDATNVGFGVYVQKYFPLNNWFAFTTKVDLGLSTGSYSSDAVNGSIITPSGGVTSGAGGAANFGFAFTPYNAFSLQANIAGFGIQSTKNDPDGVAPGNPVTNTTEFGFNVHRQTTNLTLVWFFGRGLWKKN